MFHTEKVMLAAIAAVTLIVILAYFSAAFCSFVYNYFVGIELGTSYGTMILFFLWIMLTPIIAYFSLKLKWRPGSEKAALVAYAGAIALLLAINLIAFGSIMRAAGASQIAEPGILTLYTVSPNLTIASGYSALWHTHSLKPVFYTVLSPFIDAAAFKIDLGGALIRFFPTWTVYPVVVLSIIFLCAYVVIISQIANRFSRRPILALFNVLMVGIASYALLIAVFHGGPFELSVGVGIGLLAACFLLDSFGQKTGTARKSGIALRVVLLVLIPLLLLSVFNMLSFAATNVEAVSYGAHLVVSTAVLLAGVIYCLSLSDKKTRRFRVAVALVLAVLMVINLLTFVPFPYVRSTFTNNGYVYMTLSTASTTKAQYLARIANITEISNTAVVGEDGTLLLVRGQVNEVGVTSTYLEERIIGGRFTSLEANYHFVFGASDNATQVVAYVPDNGTLARENFSIPEDSNLDVLSIMLYLQDRVPYIIGYHQYSWPGPEQALADFAVPLVPMTYLSFEANALQQ